MAVGAVSACVIMCAILGLAVALFIIVPRAQAKQLIEYTFKEGENLSQEVISEQTITMTILGQQQIVDQTIGLAYDVVVDEVLPDNTARLTFTYTWVKLKQDSASSHIDYEATAPVQTIDITDENFAGEVYGAMIGESFTVIVSADGRLIDIQGMNEILSRLIGKFQVSDSERTVLQENMQSQFNEDTMKEMMGNSFNIYSRQPVKVGDTWDSTQIIASMFPVIVDTTYKLVECNADTSTIQVKSTVRPNPDGKPLQSGQTEILYELEGDQEGQFVIDASGWDVNGVIEQHLTGTMRITSGGKTMEIPASLESNTTIKTERK
jgi:hypothetical protein